MSAKDDTPDELSLTRAAEHLLQECRMILPGIQVLFGFQMVVVFNSSFAEKLDLHEQRFHLAALGLVALANIFIMAPAAYHRHAGSRHVSRRFVILGSRFLLWSMGVLALSLSIEFRLIAGLIVDRLYASLGAAVLLGLFVSVWFVLPRLHSRNRGDSDRPSKERRS